MSGVVTATDEPAGVVSTADDAPAALVWPTQSVLPWMIEKVPVAGECQQSLRIQSVCAKCVATRAVFGKIPIPTRAPDRRGGAAAHPRRAQLLTRGVGAAEGITDDEGHRGADSELRSPGNAGRKERHNRRQSGFRCKEPRAWQFGYQLTCWSWWFQW